MLRPQSRDALSLPDDVSGIRLSAMSRRPDAGRQYVRPSYGKGRASVAAPSVRETGSSKSVRRLAALTNRDPRELGAGTATSATWRDKRGTVSRKTVPPCDHGVRWIIGDDGHGRHAKCACQKRDRSFVPETVNAAPVHVNRYERSFAPVRDLAKRKAPHRDVTPISDAAYAAAAAMAAAADRSR